MDARGGTEVGGVVLAAGGSRRMGRPKPLLEVHGTTFVARVVEVLAGSCGVVVVVTRADDGAAAREAEARGAVVVPNPDPDSQQVESLRLGLGALPDAARAAVVLPVDHPLVDRGTVELLVARWRAAPDRIVRPVRDGRPGHPTVFPRAVWSALAGDLPRGARSVVEDPSQPVEDVAVEDPGVIADVDTPEAYARWVEAP